YYGSFYNNNQSNALNITGGKLGLASFTPIALPPDNQAQQLYLTGGHNLPQNTRGQLKLPYNQATQEDHLISPGHPPPPPGDARQPDGARGHDARAGRNRVDADSEADAARRPALRGPRRQDADPRVLHRGLAHVDLERRERAAVDPDQHRQGRGELRASRRI